MRIWHGEAGKKKTGGKIRLGRKKRKYELGRTPILAKIGKEKRKVVRCKGGIKKVKIISGEFVNVSIKGKTGKLKILGIVENPANPHFVRMGVITKGAIVKTEKGLVKITSRPGQNGTINGILIDNLKEKI